MFFVMNVRKTFHFYLHFTLIFSFSFLEKMKRKRKKNIFWPPDTGDNRKYFSVFFFLSNLTVVLKYRKKMIFFCLLAHINHVIREILHPIKVRLAENICRIS